MTNVDLVRLAGSRGRISDAPTVDLVTAEVIRGGMETVCFEMAEYVSRTATTPILNQSNERNATILDAQGRLAALSVGIPQFMLTSTLPVRFALDFLGAAEFREGDVFVANDPYHGGGHLPDYNVFSPVFADDGNGGRRMVLIASIQCHHGDTGGGVPGGYNVTATDCTLTGECASTASSAVPFTVTNTAPTITTPVASDTVNGTLHFAATSSGGGVAFFVDGTLVAFAPSAPYTAVAAAPSVNGTHTISARQCTVSGSSCSGPIGGGFTITTNAFALAATPLSPKRFSPNGDKVDDVTLSTLTIPAGPAEPTYITVYDSTGKTVYTTATFGSYAPGNHTVSWSGKSNNGSTITNGVYTVVFETTKGAGQWSSVLQRVTVDLTKPTLTGTTGSGRTFYPVHDNFADTFVPTTKLSETSTLSLVITTSSGSPVRTISATRSGATNISWTGYNSAGHLVPAGTYHWHWVARDLAGNSTTSPTYTVTLSLRKLVTHTANVVVHANAATRKIEFGDDGHVCVFYASGADQHYSQGLELYDLCADDGPPYEGAGALYKIAVPAATVYNSVGMTITGFTGSGTGMLFGGFNLVSSATDLPTGEQTYPNQGLFVTNTSTATHGLGSVVGAFHVSKTHYVYAEWDVTNQGSFNAADWDAAYLTIIVHYQLLQ